MSQVQSQPFLSITGARTAIEEAMVHYESAPAWFLLWLDDLYIRLGEAWRPITLDEVATLAALHGEDGWMPESIAVNTVYKMYDRLGRDTAGILGY